MKLSVYSGRDLQMVISVLEQSKTCTIPNILIELREEIEKRHAPVSSNHSSGKKCPECGTVMQEPCLMNRVESLDRLGCPECFYSEVVS